MNPRCPGPSKHVIENRTQLKFLYPLGKHCGAIQRHGTPADTRGEYFESEGGKAETA